MPFIKTTYPLKLKKLALTPLRPLGIALFITSTLSLQLNGLGHAEAENASSWANTMPAAMATASSAPADTPDPVGLCLLPKARNKYSLNQIYEFEHSRLGNRIPVILVPGRAEEFQHNSWWKGFYRTTNRNSEFKKQFKVYAFLYNSSEELDVQAQGLAKDLKQRFMQLPARQPMMLVTYSLGGVIARNALKDNELLQHVDTQIAIAVPFHGSPMFDPDWFSEYLNPPNRSPLRRFWDRTLYHSYMFSKSNLTRGLKWDNFDSSKPQFNMRTSAKESSKLAGDQALSKMQPYQEYPNADAIRQKTIVYASYLTNGYTNTSQPFKRQHLPEYVLDNSLAFPKEMVASILPFYGFTVHSVFTYMNQQMANIPTYTPENPQGFNIHLYRYNDGAIPISSMLFLPSRPTPYNEDIQGLVARSTVRKARIFVNLDHLHLGEYSFLKKLLVKPDIIHPYDGAYSPYKWLEKDLLDRKAELSAPNPPH